MHKCHIVTMSLYYTCSPAETPMILSSTSFAELGGSLPISLPDIPHHCNGAPDAFSITSTRSIVRSLEANDHQNT